MSLPSRERGLKFAPDIAIPSLNTSLPSRERGLKSSASLHGFRIRCRSLRGSVD